MITAWIFALVSIFLTGFGQMLLKIGARKKDERNQLTDAYINLYVIIAYGLFFMVTLFSVYALRDIPLKVFYSLTSLNFLIVLIFSCFVLKESVNREQVIGVGLIVFGVIIFNI